MVEPEGFFEESALVPDAVSPWRVPVGDQGESLACPYAPEGEVAKSWRIDSRRAWRAALRELAADPTLHCALFEPAGELTTETLVPWIAEAKLRLRLPIGLRELDTKQPCGACVLCMGEMQHSLTEALERLETLGTGEAAVYTALRKAFPRLKSKDLEVLYSWALLPSRENPSLPITWGEIQAKHKCPKSTVGQILSRSREQNPYLYTRLDQHRTQRLRRTKCYVVKTT